MFLDIKGLQRRELVKKRKWENRPDPKMGNRG